MLLPSQNAWKWATVNAALDEAAFASFGASQLTAEEVQAGSAEPL